MRVRCIANDFGEMGEPIRVRLAESIRLEGADRSLIVDGVYIVLAIERWSDGGIRIYLHAIKESYYPYPYPMEMFEVFDASVSPGWCMAFGQGLLGTNIKRVSFPEWAGDDSFYEKLVDGDEKTVATYMRRKEELLSFYGDK